MLPMVLAINYIKEISNFLQFLTMSYNSCIPFGFYDIWILRTPDLLRLLYHYAIRNNKDLMRTNDHKCSLYTKSTLFIGRSNKYGSDVGRIAMKLGIAGAVIKIFKIILIHDN